MASGASQHYKSSESVHQSQKSRIIYDNKATRLAASLLAKVFV